jgi:hypothetical protein
LDSSLIIISFSVIIPFIEIKLSNA